MTFEQLLRGWVAAGYAELAGDVSVTGYGVTLRIGPLHRYDARNFFVNGNEVIEMTSPNPPPKKEGP